MIIIILITSKCSTNKYIYISSIYTVIKYNARYNVNAFFKN